MKERPKTDLELMRNDTEIREVGIKRKVDYRQAGRWNG